MHRTALWLTLAAAWFAVPAAAAPAPVPPSEGPISDAVALRGLLPKTAPPLAASAVMPEDGLIEMQRQAVSYVQQIVMETVVQPDGKKVEVARTVTGMVFVPVTFRVKADAVKFYTVGKDGKLEALDPAKAKDVLKHNTPVLTGDGTDVDPRNLDLVRPGTLYLVLPVAQAETIPQPRLPSGTDKP